MYALTNEVTLVFSALVSRFTDSVVVPSCLTFIVTPWIASLTLLDELLIAMPFTVSLVSWAADVCFMFCAPAGS